MAQTAVTVARRHGEKSFEVLIDPSVHPGEHVQEFRKIAGDREHPEFAEVQLWTSGEGVTKSKRFREPELLESKENTQPEKTAPEAEFGYGFAKGDTAQLRRLLRVVKREPELLESKEDTQPEKTAPEAPAATQPEAPADAPQIAQVDAPANTTTGEAKAKPKAK